MNQLEIPEEIFEQIIEHLGDDRAALIACSTTSRRLLLICRAQLFHALRIFHTITDQRRAKFERLRDILKANPGMGKYVHHLWLYLQASDSTPGTDTDLLSVLDKFDNLQSLEILSIYPGSFLWQGISPEMQNSIQRLLRLPSLTSLRFHRQFDIPTSILEGATAVKNIILTATSWSTIGTEFHDLPLPRPTSLRILQYSPIGEDNSVYKYLQQSRVPFLIHDLTSLDVELMASTVPCIQSILETNRDISDLKVTFRRVAHNLDLSVATAMETLSVTADLHGWYQDVAAHNADAMLWTLMSITPSSSCLKSIHMEVNIPPEEIDIVSWDRLDDIFVRLKRDGALETVRVHLSSLVDYAAAFPPIIDRLPKCLQLGLFP
ncbi:hypothetical protein BDN72DRAFT_862646 [Pluteus cervinus]|uniref:Uncharacterized protein n=1 Tax=Pluteus cervinus TaxID=181527 RepID=A0ACD3AAE0_9AGAR|nr:hypothetical protein BDN72DRAFT_862646 [Pluteus cervinus]